MAHGFVTNELHSVVAPGYFDIYFWMVAQTTQYEERIRVVLEPRKLKTYVEEIRQAVHSVSIASVLVETVSVIFEATITYNCVQL